MSAEYVTEHDSRREVEVPSFAYTRAIVICAIIATTIFMLAFSSGHSNMFSGSSFLETRVVVPGGRSVSIPSKGVFLIASRDIMDPGFRETVIFLISQDENGAMGVIINRPTNVSLSQALPDIKTNDFIYAGGPVAVNQLLMFVRSGSPPEKSLRLFDNVYISSDAGYPGHMTNKPKGDQRFRVYAGYAGWAPGQLEREISRNDWLTIEGGSDLIFDKPASSVWNELIGKKSAIEVMNRESKLHKKFFRL